MKPFGPLQLYVAPLTKLAVKLKFCPAQIGALLVNVSDPGGGAIVTLITEGTLVHPFSVAVNV